MAFESLNKIAPALFSPEQDLIEVYNKKTGTVGVINPSYIKSSPSGSAGAIQFSDGSAFASDASKFFWDNTNKRLGIGTNAPISPIHIDYTTTGINGLYINQSGGTSGSHTSALALAIGGTVRSSISVTPTSGEVRFFVSSGGFFPTFYANGSEAMRIDGSQNVNIGATALGARLGIKGSGSTSATTSLLVQNSAGSTALQVQDNLICNFGGNLTVISGGTIGVSNGSRSITFDSTGATNLYTAFGGHRFSTYNQSSYIDFVTITGNTTTPSLLVGVGTVNNSAIVNLTSTTQGFLPPRMTTTQINAIASPAEGLVAYNTTISHLCVYQSGAWVKLNHSPM